MPHSTASAPMLSDGLVEEDGVLLDAPDQIPDPAKEEGNISLIDVASQLEESTGEAPRTDVKLEDLFNDVHEDEDDEFSGSGVLNCNESSPLEAPM